MTTLKLLILIMIIFNSVFVKYMTFTSLIAQEEEYGALLTGVSKFFLTLFVMEILIKWHHDFLGYWRVAWNIFDFTVIFISFIIPSK